MEVSSSDLNSLIQRIAGGEREAFDVLYEATSAKLLGVILRILRDRQHAEEILQEVYIRLWRNASGFDPDKASAITWLCTIARNRALDEVRRKQIDTVDDPDRVDGVENDGLSVEKQFSIDQDMRRLSECMEGLEPDHGDAIRLAYLDGFSRKELARRFGQPLGTIKSWLHRGLIQLRECLQS